MPLRFTRNLASIRGNIVIKQFLALGLICSAVFSGATRLQSAEHAGVEQKSRLTLRELVARLDELNKDFAQWGLEARLLHPAQEKKVP